MAGRHYPRRARFHDDMSVSSPAFASSLSVVETGTRVVYGPFDTENLACDTAKNCVTAEVVGTVQAPRRRKFERTKARAMPASAGDAIMLAVAGGFVSSASQYNVIKISTTNVLVVWSMKLSMSKISCTISMRAPKPGSGIIPASLNSS